MYKYNADVVAKSIFHNMVSDFRLLHGHTFAQTAVTAFGMGVPEFRGVEWPRLGLMHPSRFKAWWQLRHLFKKHRFDDDLYTDDQLAQLTNSSYVDFQQSVKLLDNMNPVILRVCQEARRIAKEILGKFDPSAIVDYAKFGKRSSIGCSFQKAYIDFKLTVPSAFTSTAKARQWFFNCYLPSDPVLRRIVRRLFRTAKRQREAFNFVCTSLKLVNVPKSWKTLRTITPLSLIELFYTFAVGGVIQKCLADYGLDITILQEVHRELAKEGSREPGEKGRRKIATLDLSRASDSVLSQLLNKSLPRDWYNALKPAFCRQVTVDGEIMATHTVLPMGNGFTFPVETLLFYCLTKAIGNLTRIRGTYSVYGDDIICPIKLYRYVSKIFPLLGLTINEEKSYANSFFRESCGGDYYRGCDVRPYTYTADSQSMSRLRYLAHLYKVFNGIRRRWTAEELPNTFRFLMAEITYVGGRVLQVPPSYPDYSGVRVENVEKWTWQIPWSRVTSCGKYRDKKLLRINPHNVGSHAYLFQHLRAEPGKRVVLHTEPYYWLAYRRLGTEVEDFDAEPQLTPHEYIVWRKRVAKHIEVLDSTLQGYLKGFARIFAKGDASRDVPSEQMLKYVQRKGEEEFDPLCTVRGNTIVTGCSSVVTFWA